jgi:hypothetical protein
MIPQGHDAYSDEVVAQRRRENEEGDGLYYNALANLRKPQLVPEGIGDSSAAHAVRELKSFKAAQRDPKYQKADWTKVSIDSEGILAKRRRSVPEELALSPVCRYTVAEKHRHAADCTYHIIKARVNQERRLGHTTYHGDNVGRIHIRLQGCHVYRRC